MKHTIFATIMAGALLFAGCDSMLDTTNYEKKDTSNFPQTETDAEQIITSIYNRLAPAFLNPEQTNFFSACLAGDEQFGGGSTSNTSAQSDDRLMFDQTEGFSTPWSAYYKGIFRANYALQVIPTMDDDLFTSKDTKNYLIGQAYFLRGWFDWQMADLFETFPLLESTEPVNNPRTDVETVYASIASDLKNAIDYMPASYTYSNQSGYAGRATKYSAEALLARVWMFYTGFYGKSDLAGISKSQIVNYLKDARDNSGYGLIDDPRELWAYTNDYSSGVEFGTDFGTYVNKENLHWVGHHSKEAMWAVSFSYVERSSGYNRIPVCCGLRNKASSPNAACYPYGIGYTNGTVNPKFVESWATDSDYGFTDKRLWGSVLSVDNASEVYGGGVGGDWMKGQATELPSHVGNDSKEVEKTLLHNKKQITVASYVDATKAKIYKTWYNAIPGFSGYNYQETDVCNDVIFIRYADVLLMLDELEETVTGMNQLRARAGLKPYSSYSFEKLQKERKFEFAFEGIRWDDLRRWYPKDAGKIIEENQTGAYVEYRGNIISDGYEQMPGNSFSKRYSETRGFFRIPPTQITLSLDVLTQTPGWEDENSSSWVFSNGSLPYHID